MKLKYKILITLRKHGNFSILTRMNFSWDNADGTQLITDIWKQKVKISGPSYSSREIN